MWNNEKPGFIMILASLLVMGVTVYLLFDYELANREKQAREQGLGLARLLSSMSWEQVVNLPGRKGILEAVQQGQNNPDFAYGVITDINNQVRSEVTAAGIITPTAPLPVEPASWLGQRVVGDTSGANRYIESHAPLFHNQQHMGFVRIGYLRPELELSYRQMPFMATLTLPIFLLTPLFYFFLRREMQPLRTISQSIDSFAQKQSMQPPELQPSAELGNFMDRFNQFIEMTQHRIDQLSNEQNDLMMSGKLLSYKNNRVETILQTIPEAIMVIDEAGIVSYANQRINNLLGVSPQDILNKKPQSWCESDDILRALNGANGQGSTSIDHVIGGEDGQQKKLSIRNYPLFAPGDETRLLGRLVVITDITESFYEQQRQGEFISQIAHELKTPLNVLAMYSESLLEVGMTSDEHRIEAANVIHDEVERLSTLIQNLLSISQCELGGLVIERQRVRAVEFLQDIFDNMRNSDRARSVEFELDLPREMSPVFIDKALMRIAINNLLTNAIKYNKPGGAVRMEAEETRQGIEIRVIDEGLGISEQDQQRIFEKFFRSEDTLIRQQTGHGLGLSLTQQIVHIHQGEISVSSAPGEGSTFLITLEKGTES